MPPRCPGSPSEALQPPRRTLPEALETLGVGGDPGKAGRGRRRPAPSVPPASPELVPGSAPREAPAIRPCVCQAPKSPPHLPACVPTLGCRSVPHCLPPGCPRGPALSCWPWERRGSFPQCGWWRPWPQDGQKLGRESALSWVTWSLALYSGCHIARLADRLWLEAIS